MGFFDGKKLEYEVKKVSELSGDQLNFLFGKGMYKDDQISVEDFGGFNSTKLRPCLDSHLYDPINSKFQYACIKYLISDMLVSVERKHEPIKHVKAVIQFNCGTLKESFGKDVYEASMRAFCLGKFGETASVPTFRHEK